MRASRRNISITSQEVDDILDSVENVSQFIQDAVIFYHRNLNQDGKVKYITEVEFEKRIKNLESKYNSVEQITNEIVEMIFQMKSQYTNDGK